MQVMCLLLSAWIGSPAAFGQRPNERENETEVNGRVLEQNQIRPAFRVEPIVHRLEARRGEDIPIEFSLLSTGRPTRLLIKPIAITQRENGVIAVDESVPAPDAVRVEGPEIVSMESGADHIIKAHVRVPLVKSTFHSFGILVRDLGLDRDDPRKNANDDSIRFGVKFVTQYLLRADISVLGVQSEDISQLEFQSVELAEEDGRAKLQTFLFNPTDSPMALEVNCQILKKGASEGHALFGLAMPIRLHMPEPENHQIKILPKTRLQLEEFIPHPLAAGEHAAHFTVLDGRRIGKTSVLNFNVDLLDFPAQNTNLVAISEVITAEPAQVELSLARGGKRVVPLKLKNFGNNPVTLKLSAVIADGSLSEYVDVRPDQTTIRPGGTRNVLLMLKSTTDLAEHQYAYLKVDTVNAGQSEEPLEMVKLAMISRSEKQPELQFENMVWDASGSTPALVLPVMNLGGKHVPLHGTMTITSIDGASMKLVAGYGRWLLPGEKDKFRFRFKTLPPAGQYTVNLVIDLGPDLDPIETTSTIQFSAGPTSNGQ